jgi:hypothetical protein
MRRCSATSVSPAATKPLCSYVAGTRAGLPITPRQHFYRDVKGLGNVAVSRHAQANMDGQGISQELFERVLLSPSKPDVQEDLNTLWRERENVRLVIINPTPNTGARLVKTVFRIKARAQAIRR